jgi:Ca-activated chloride channel family protein
MTFLSLEYLLLLVLLPLLVGAYLLGQRRGRPTAARYSSLSLIRAARPGGRSWRRHVPFALFGGAVGALALALARPAILLDVAGLDRTIVLAMDVSRSMCSTDIRPTRLAAAQLAAIDFVAEQDDGARVGLVAFSDFAAVLVAPDPDHSEVIAAIRGLRTGRRTAIGNGILRAIDAIAEVDPNVARSTDPHGLEHEPPPVPKGAFVPDIIVLLTDGANTVGVDPLLAAQEARTRGLRVYTIGYGTPNGEFGAPCAPELSPEGADGVPSAPVSGVSGGRFQSALDEGTLRRIARITGGAYYPAESAGDLERVFAALPRTEVVARETVEVSVAFLALASLLAGVGLLLGRAWRPLP